ncbi:YybH family protein [Tenacibaculum sp. ZS6-P6]|uniref:YybH family protein n=1 Tax=Tenacibaculum sp. ZS6-P6 TaxID=3447503 RepID=UPI003F9BF64D
MKKLLLIFTVIICSCTTSNEEQDKKEIRALMKHQASDWSRHDLDCFMLGYWKSDSLKFQGRNGITYGWKKTLEKYKKSYPYAEDSGKLKFKIRTISKIESNSYYVMGEYNLTRETGKLDGIFMVIFKKIKGEWKIIADTSC